MIELARIFSNIYLIKKGMNLLILFLFFKYLKIMLLIYFIYN